MNGRERATNMTNTQANGITTCDVDTLWKYLILSLYIYMYMYIYELGTCNHDIDRCW